jgi:hypothetical protein
MEASRFAAVFVVYAFLAVMFLSAFVVWGKDWRAERERARERRMAEHRLNARLLRLNI